MTPQEATKQALDALENNTGEFRIEGAKTILRDAIAEMEKAEPVAIVSSVVSSGEKGVRVRWLRGFPKISTKLYTYPPIPEGWLRAVDEELVVIELGVANASDTYQEARAKLQHLIAWHVNVALDPAVNDGWQLVPIEPTEDMLDAAKRSGAAGGDIDISNDYKAMLVAAPKPGETE